MVHTLVFFTYFWGSLFVSMIIAVPYALLRVVRLSGPLDGLVQAVVRGWARSNLLLLGARLDIAGRENIPNDRKLCYIANHQSATDMLILISLFPRPMGFIAKREMLLMPFLNIWISILRGIFLDRTNVAKGKQVIDRGIETIRSGYPMGIFPEGTRSRGPEMGVFRRGAVKLATRSGATIVPVTIDGAYRVWEEQRRIVPTTVKVTIHPPVPTEGMPLEQRRELADRLERTIASALRSPSERRPDEAAREGEKT